MTLPNVCGVFGAPGQGKSTFLRAQIRDRGVRRYITVDPWATDPDGIEVDAIVVGDLGLALREIAKLPGDTRWSFGFVPREGEESEAAGLLARAAFARGATLIVDEAHEAAGQHTAAPELLRIARRGRHVGSRLWLASLRPADVHRSLTSGSERVFFWLEEPTDREYVRRTVGKGAERIVSELEPGHFLYKCGKIALLGRIHYENNEPQISKLRDLTDSELQDS